MDFITLLAIIFLATSLMLLIILKSRNEKPKPNSWIMIFALTSSLLAITLGLYGLFY